MTKSLRFYVTRKGNPVNQQHGRAAGDGPGDQGAKQQGRQVHQRGPAAQYCHGGQNLAGVVGGGPGDGHPKEGEKAAPQQQGHDAKGQQPAGEGKGQGHQIAPQQGAQKAAGGQNQQGLPPGQAAKGINGDQIGQSQPQAGQGEENGQRNQPLRHREGQRQGGKHRAAGQPPQG